MKLLGLIGICVSIFMGIEAVEPNIRIYFELPIGSGNINLYRKFESDISGWQQYLNAAHAYCWTGLWQMFDHNNAMILNTDFSEDLGNCDDGQGLIPLFYTGRFLGPNDTDTVAIAFYEAQPGAHFLSGAEFIVENTSSVDEFPFDNLPAGLVTFGHSNWTLFEGKNLTGNSFCFQSQGIVDILELKNATQSTVQSVKLGC